MLKSADPSAPTAAAAAVAMSVIRETEQFTLQDFSRPADIHSKSAPSLQHREKHRKRKEQIRC